MLSARNSVGTMPKVEMSMVDVREWLEPKEDWRCMWENGEKERIERCFGRVSCDDGAGVDVDVVEVIVEEERER